MPIAIKSITVGTNTGSSPTVSVTTSESPSATAIGDLVVVIHGNDYYALSNMGTGPTATGSPTINAIAAAVADAGSPNAHVKGYWYVANTAGAQTISATETGSADEEKLLIAYVLSGADTVTAVDIAGNNASTVGTNPWVAPSVSPTGSDGFLIVHANSGGGSASAPHTSPGSMTEQYDANTGGIGYVGATEQLSASGATGTRSFTPTGSPSYAAVSIVIKTSGGGAAAPDGYAAPWTLRPPGRISPAGMWTPTRGDVEVASTVVTGTLASTLSGATLAASGSEVITGTAASTLAGATLAASGSEVITGTLGTTLSGATLTASGSELIAGSFATTLGGATLAASGTVANPVTGTLAVTLSGATLAASGTASASAVTGTLAVTLAGATLAASGAEVFTGTFAATLSPTTLAATGSERMTGTLAVTLSGATLSANGVEAISGTLTTTLAGTTLAAAGAVTAPPVTGTLTVTLSGSTLTATGSIAVPSVPQPFSGMLGVVSPGSLVPGLGPAAQPPDPGTPATIARAVVSIAIFESAVAPHHAARAEVGIPTTTALVRPESAASASATIPALEV